MQRRILYSILSGVLFSLAWTQWGMGWTLLIAFIPLFFVEEEVYQKRIELRSINVFYYAYISFFTWNLISTWWVSNSTIGGGVAAVVLNSLWYAILFWVFHIIKRREGKYVGYLALIFLWLAFENIYINGEISWVWLILGNGFANNTELIQWYEYTGALGGSLWVLLVNVFLFNSILSFIKNKTIYRQYLLISSLMFIIIVPIIISQVILHNYQEKKDSVSVSLVQPNIDPYNDKFGGMSQQQQLDKMLDLINTKGNDTADFFVLPETAIGGVMENDFYASSSIRRISSFMKAYPNTNMVFGASTSYVFEDGHKTKTSRVYPLNPQLNYDIYNTALQINNKDDIQKYHKSKLVIGVEMMPYPSLFNLVFNKNIIDLGGITSNHGTQEKRGVFNNSMNKAKIGPVVCYESIYGEFVTDYIREGANAIFIITNDAWWGDTPGYHQHLSFAKLRAIENRRSIARCANTGISAIINQKGEIEKYTKYWEEDVLNGTLNLNSKMTFFSRNGDLIGLIARIISLFIFLFLGVERFRRNKS